MVTLQRIRSLTPLALVVLHAILKYARINCVVLAVPMRFTLSVWTRVHVTHCKSVAAFPMLQAIQPLTLVSSLDFSKETV